MSIETKLSKSKIVGFLSSFIIPADRKSKDMLFPCGAWSEDVFSSSEEGEYSTAPGYLALPLVDCSIRERASNAYFNAQLLSNIQLKI